MLQYLFLACSQDVSILKLDDRNEEDTSIVSIDSEGSDAENENIEDTDVSEEDTNSSDNQEYIGYGGVLKYSLRQVACPACIGEQNEISVYFSGEFYSPVSDSSLNWIAQSGCSNSFFETNISSTPESYGSQININWANGSSVLNMNGVGSYISAQIPEAYYSRNTPHSVYFPDLNKEYIDAFISISGFDSIEPYTMLWVDPTYAFEQNFNSYSNNTISWSPSGTDVTFQILITFYDYSTLQPIGSTNCFGPDIGYMSIPSNYFSFPAYTYLTIQITKHRVSSFEFDQNYSNIETHMSWEVVGTGMLR